MRNSITAMVFLALVLGATATAAAQALEKVGYFEDSIAEKGDRNHILRLSGGSNWVLADPTLVPVQTSVLVVVRDVNVEGKVVHAAWFYVGGAEIPAKHADGVYPTNQAYLTRVVGAEGGAALRLADGSRLAVAHDDLDLVRRWIPPYKALVTGGHTFLYNLKEGKRAAVQPKK